MIKTQNWLYTELYTIIDFFVTILANGIDILLSTQ